MAKSWARKQGKERSTAKLVRANHDSGISEMQAHVYDCDGNNDPARFIETTKEFANYLQRSSDKGAADVATSVRRLELVDLTLPDVATAVDAGGAALTGLAEKIWLGDYQDRKRHVGYVQQGIKKAYAIAIKLCSPRLITKLQGSNGFEAIDNTEGVVGLLLLIQGIVTNFTDQRQKVWSLVQAKKRVLLFYQLETMSNDKYVEQFKARVLVVETYGGSFSQEPVLLRDELAEAGVVPAAVPPADQDLLIAATAVEMEAAKKIVRSKVLAAMFLNGASSKRFKMLTDDIANQFTFGQDNYPTTLEDAVRLLNNYRGSGAIYQAPRYDDEEAEELAFMERGDDDDDGRDAAAERKKTRNCHYCDKIGHYKHECKKYKKDQAAKASGDANMANTTGAETAEAESGISQLNFDEFEDDDDDYDDGDGMLVMHIESDDEWIYDEDPELVSVPDSMPDLIEREDSSDDDASSYAGSVILTLPDYTASRLRTFEELHGPHPHTVDIRQCYKCHKLTDVAKSLTFLDDTVCHACLSDTDDDPICHNDRIKNRIICKGNGKITFVSRKQDIVGKSSTDEDASYDEFLLILACDKECDIDCESIGDSSFKNFLEYLATPSSELQVGRNLVSTEMQVGSGNDLEYLAAPSTELKVGRNLASVEMHVGTSDTGINMANKSQPRRLNPFYAYLDTCSTFHQAINPEIISDIKEVVHSLKSYSNGGISKTKQIAKYGGQGFAPK